MANLVLKHPLASQYVLNNHLILKESLDAEGNHQIHSILQIYSKRILFYIDDNGTPQTPASIQYWYFYPCTRKAYFCLVFWFFSTTANALQNL